MCQNMLLFTRFAYDSIALAIFLVCSLFTGQRLIRYAATRRICREKGCQPPPSLPQWDPIFGLDIILTQLLTKFKSKSRNRLLQSLFTSHGSTFSTRLYGRTQYFTIAPSNIEAIYSTDFASWGVGPVRGFIFGPLLGPGLMTEDGAVWKHSRAIIAPLFTKSQFAGLESFNLHINRLMDHIPKSGGTVDLQPLFNRLALDTTTEMLFGESVQSLTLNPPAEAQEFLDAFNYAQREVGNRMVKPFWNVLTQDMGFWKSCKLCHDFVDGVVSRAIQRSHPENASTSQTKKYVLVDELVKSGASAIDIRRQLLNVFLPAHDAIAIPLTNIFFQLARHPDKYSKVREEVLTLPDTSVTDAIVLQKLPYLRMIIDETFRLYPGVTTNERVALDDTILPTGGGPLGTAPVFVSKGDLVTMSFYALSRHQDVWGPNAEEWKPERWDHDRVKQAPWTSLPFGGGPRVCPGREQGLAQIALTMVRIVRDFRQLVNKDPVEEFEDLFRVVTISRNGCRVACVEA